MYISLVMKSLMGQVDGWDATVKKYGVRISVGTMICGSLQFVDNEGFHIIGHAVGGDDRYPEDKKVTIEASDVSHYRLGAGEWVEIKEGQSIEVVY